MEAGIAAANQNFVLARSVMSDETLNVALMAPKQEVYLETETRNVMSVEMPVFHYKTRTSDANDIYSYGFAFTSGDLDDAVKTLADILPDMLRLAECEKSCQLMAAEIEKTRRRVNALEHVMIPETQAEHSIYHHEAGRERAKHPDPADESEGYDAGRSAPGTNQRRCGAGHHHRVSFQFGEEGEEFLGTRTKGWRGPLPLSPPLHLFLKIVSEFYGCIR